MPNRIIREDMLTDERVNRLSAAAELFLRRLWSIADDYGRYDARPAILRARCYPLRVDKVREADISRWLVECQAAGVIALYAVDGAGRPRWLADVQPAGLCVSGFDRGIYLQIIGYDQQVRSRSRWPDPPSEPPQQNGGACMRVMADDSRCDHLPSDDRLDGDGVGDVCVGDDCTPLTPLRGGTKRRASDPPEWAMTLAALIEDTQCALTANRTRASPERLRRSAREIERLHSIDHHDIPIIEAVVRWVVQDRRDGNGFPGWGRVVQCGRGLREKWNRIIVQWEARNGTHRGGVARPGAAGQKAGMGYTALQRERQRELEAALGEGVGIQRVSPVEPAPPALVGEPQGGAATRPPAGGDAGACGMAG